MKKFLLVTIAMLVLGFALAANASTFVTNIPEFNGGYYTDPGPFQIGRASLGKECRSRWSPYH